MVAPGFTGETSCVESCVHQLMATQKCSDKKRNLISCLTILHIVVFVGEIVCLAFLREQVGFSCKKFFTSSTAASALFVFISFRFIIWTEPNFSKWSRILVSNTCWYLTVALPLILKCAMNARRTDAADGVFANSKTIHSYSFSENIFLA